MTKNEQEIKKGNKSTENKRTSENLNKVTISLSRAVFI